MSRTVTRRLADANLRNVIDTAFRGVIGLAIVAAMLAAVWVAHSSGEDPAATPASARGVGAQTGPPASTLSSARAYRSTVYRTGVAPAGNTPGAPRAPTGPADRP